MDRKDLQALFELIDGAPLKCSSLLMNERDYADIAGEPCPQCGRMISAFTNHDALSVDCELCAVRAVMEG